MTTLTRWDPFKELQEMQERLGTFFGRPPVKSAAEKEAMTVPQWAPLVDISEDPKEFLIKAELPEVKREEIKVTVDDGVLSITGERKFEKEEKDKKYHRIERAYGSFVRNFTLPENTDTAKVTAEFDDGVLEVHVPKTETPKARSLEVKVG